MGILPVVEFEGQTIKPSRGVYHCPFGCERSDYPKPSWKTEMGFRKHLATCPMSPSAVAVKQEKQKQRQAVEDLKREEALASVKHKIGDPIYYVMEVIVSPTHVQRGSRRVHVRYEPVKRFDWGLTNVKRIDWLPAWGVILNGDIRAGDVYASEDQAKTEATRRQNAWDEHVKFSEMCR